MAILMKNTHLAYLIVVYILIVLVYTRAQKFGEAKLMYEWKSLEFDWPSAQDELQAINNGTYRPERSLLAGIKVYKDNVFLTIPRWFWTTGHPVTLAKVVRVDGKDKLRPYPSWASQKQGDCKALQYVQGIEIDSNTGFLYVIDTGRIGNSENLCPAKIVIYDLNTDTELQKYEIPDAVVSKTKSFLNDIVLDYVEGKVRYAYVTNTYEHRILAYDFQSRSASYIEDPSMEVEASNASVISVNGKDYNFSVAIDGIAMSPDFKYVYYCALGGYNLYQVPTSVLRNIHHPRQTGVRLVGRKVSQTDGLGHGNKHLYFTAVGLNAVYYWDAESDMSQQKVGMNKVTLGTQIKLVENNITMQWPDTFGFDERGWIWFISNRLQDFAGSSGLPDEADAYMRVWKVYVNETSYLYQADSRTKTTNSARTIMPAIALSTNSLCFVMLFSLIISLV